MTTYALLYMSPQELKQYMRKTLYLAKFAKKTYSHPSDRARLIEYLEEYLRRLEYAYGLLILTTSRNT